MAKQKVLVVAGARPNYMKVAPICWAAAELARGELTLEVVHTGQHYDASMSEDFFRDLDISPPVVNLAVGSGSHAEQTSRVMVGFERVVLERRPDVVVVVGDVNSTLACALVVAKLPVEDGRCRPLLAHVEAGLRSRDRDMPEEINRILTDAVSDILFTTCRDAGDNLVAEGIDPAGIRFVGNPMIDSLLRSIGAAERRGLPPPIDAAAERGSYGLCTLHRPSNVDRRDVLEGILGALSELASDAPIFLALHPRTRGRLRDFDLEACLSLHDHGKPPRRGLVALEPLAYLEMLVAMRHARLVLTDSGGIQEETTALGVPCVTIRENTERPVTISEGTNVLAGTSRAGIVAAAERATAKTAAGARVPERWDGHAGERIVAALIDAARRGAANTRRPRIAAAAVPALAAVPTAAAPVPSLLTAAAPVRAATREAAS